ncbi:MAG: nucleotidyltransferase domain-containing protein [Mollicutes bacterium]|nr:nucleotidyltransferase domain-containing protein [Mollicutes bacterium]
MNNFEILVRKQNVKFIYNLFKKLNIPIEHEHFKQIVYDEIMCKSTLDKYMKNVYSAYTYLLLNMKTMFDSTLISKYYYIMFKKEIDDELALKVVTAFYKPYNNDNIERSISFLHQLLYLFRELKEEEKYIISLSLFNYSLIYHGYKELTDIDLKEYTKEELILKLEKENRQEKSYYKELTDLSKKEIIQVLKKDEEYLRKNNIETLILFGSFTREEQRIDSDIDLLVTFSDGISYIDKCNIIQMMKEEYKSKFKRYVDITELTNLVLDNYVKELQEYYIIIGG